MTDHGVDARLETARQAADGAVFGRDPSRLDDALRGLDALQADLDLARGKVLHARYLADRHEDPSMPDLFRSAAERYRTLDDGRGEGQARFMLGIWHQVVRADHAEAHQHFRHARDLAAQAGDPMTVSSAVRHLGYVALAENRLDDARRLMQESTRLRRELGFLPGVTLNLVGLAEIEAAAGDTTRAHEFLDEAERLAGQDESGGLADLVRQARDESGRPSASGTD